MACSCHVLMSSLDPQADPVGKSGDLTKKFVTSQQ